jgi:teichuronic acid biosynthesis glycosyltransferase TuaC
MHRHSLKVLVVSRLYPRPSDPVLGVFVEEEIRALSGHCQLKVASPVPWFPRLKIFKKWYAYTRAPVRELREGVDVFRPRAIVFPRNFLFAFLGLSFYLALRRCVNQLEKAFPFDLIHAHTVYPDGFAAVMLGRAFGRPTVITLHGGDVTLYLKHPLVRRMGLWALSKSDRAIAVSDALRTEVVDEHRADARKISVIPNGVDVVRFAPMAQEEAQARLALTNEVPRILYVGGIERSKGIEYLLRAAGELRRNTEHSVEVVLIGEGKYEGQAKELATDLGIDDAVAFVGKKPNTEIPLWINACDLLVLPSLSEGFGVVLIEAMACGKPVVATRCGGPEDIVTPGTGILVSPGDYMALAQAMQEVLSGQRRFDPQEIRRQAVAKYAYDSIARCIVEEYQEIVGA